jgi:saccharopine dehydrogenase-like NADP-dependent oxidoreductase
MAKIAIVGAGIVGIAFAKITLAVTDYSIVLVDRDEDAVLNGLAQLIGAMTDLVAERIEVEELHVALDTVDLVACCTPYQHVIPIAEQAAKRGLHYLDFTEDNSVTAAIARLHVSSTFVPQTGVAPGLVNYIGLALTKDRAVQHLALRVGALPRVSFGPEHYAITWSPDGLINEYLAPVKRKVQGKIVHAEPLQDLETVVVNGVEYEAFTTSGGVGDLSAYTEVPNVEYKTLRHPGHLLFLKNLLSMVSYDQERAVQLARSTFTRTRDDVVVLAVQATAEGGEAKTIGLHFYPNHDLELTAIELTTAGTGVAVAELILTGQLSSGVLRPDQLKLQALLGTGAGRLILRNTELNADWQGNS